MKFQYEVKEPGQSLRLSICQEINIADKKKN